MSSLVNKVPLTERIAEKLISKERFQEDEESYEKVKYGMEVILINTMKIGLVYLVSLLMGVFFETLIVHFFFF
ncbi:accessory gene regulator B family protein [Listeria aquatica]|uniref:Regulator n=1 Tax=Listeria aquatica FSL S10-1188 TaxID=1265818 RepID=W7AUT9_9LIST|nr:accessory gene regulator B family protein [Listeria aquatica]EUJ17417.1 regulator [Listeria aquatica FSL S10-1188]